MASTITLRKHALRNTMNDIAKITDDAAKLERMKARQHAGQAANWYLVDQHLHSESPTHVDIQGHLLRLKFDRFVPAQDKAWLEFMMCN